MRCRLTIAALAAFVLGGTALFAQNEFFDNFDRPDGPPDGWTVYGGSWDIYGGRLRSAVSEGWIWADAPPVVLEGDFELSLKVTFPSIPGDQVGRHGGIMFFAGDPTNRYSTSGYTLDWIDRTSDHGFRLIRWSGGNATTLVNGTPGIAQPPELWQVSVSGDRIVVRGDGAAVIDLEDATYREGYFGIWTYSNTEMLVDDVEISSGPPGLRACFQAVPRSGEAPLDVSFDASCSTGSEEEGIASYSWTFGDGGTASGKTASHRFAVPGTYVVTLTVLGTAGGSASSSRTIEALEPGLPPPLDVERFLSEKVKRYGAAADSVVVFNEIMYHPPENEAALEWFELYNQMAVDVDLSNWTVLGGVTYEIPDGTVIPGGGFLVIARDPAALAAATGFAGALGPFAGRLENDGERLDLLNRAGRVMDSLRYDDGEDWSAAPDGSGVSLAKLDPLSASARPENWAPSDELGGTPGRRNFPATGSTSPLRGLRWNEYSVASASDYWIEIVNDGEAPVQLSGHRVATGPEGGFVFGAGLLAPGAHLVLSRADLGFDLRPDGKVFLYAPGGASVLDAVKLSVGNRGRRPDGSGEWLAPDVPTPGAPNSFAIEDAIVLNEIHYHPRIEPAKPDVFDDTQILALDASWKYDDSGADLGTAWRARTFDDAAWSSGAGVFYYENADLPGPKNTPLRLGPITYYFRTSFQLDRKLEGALRMSLLVDDGAVVYLNGQEVLRFNMPDGTIGASTLASSGVGDAAITGPYELPAEKLVLGTNVVAVEVHQASAASSDVVFAAELFASVLVEPGHPMREPPESWIELYNRGSRAVDLTGWTLDRAVRYAFEPGTVLRPGEHLVVAEDEDYLRAKHPGVAIVGNYAGRLSNRTDRIVLRDARGNPADSVEYFDGGRWPLWADGGGSSLELRDPRADNSKAEAWAASDESPKSGWKTYRYREVATANIGPTLWREFVIGLLSAGEILVDDLSVVQSPGSNPVQLLQNGTFESGATAWRILGNHRHSAVIDDPDRPGNKVLHLVATGPTEHMHNHLETTLVGNAVAPNGVEYEVSFRARWLAGSNQLHTRLYFNRIPQTTLIDVPDTAGTPGARNSAFEANIGPTFDRLRHAPVVPDPGQAVSVFALIDDPDGVRRATLWWSVGGGAWQSGAMSLEAGTQSLYSGRIPGQSASALVQFYVEAEDALGAVSLFPAGGRDSRALYKVKDGQARTGPLHNFRIIMTAADVAFLHAETNVMSNDRLGATVVYREEEAFYDAGVRLKGSERGRLGDSRVSYSVEFHPDQLFRGAHRTVSLDRAGGWGIGAGPNGQDEILVKHVINQAALPGMYDDLAWLIVPRSVQNGVTLLMMSKYSSSFLSTQYPDEGEGSLYKVELIYYPTTTVDGRPESLKRPQPDEVIGTDLRDLGDDKEVYRWNFLLENNEDRDDYANFIQLSKAMSSSGSEFAQRMERRLDVDEATRMYVVHSLFGVSDSYWSGSNSHNVMFYELAAQGRFVILAWDDDFAFAMGTNAPLWGGPNLTRLFSIPRYERLFYGHLKDILDEVFNSAYMRRWTDHYGSLAQETGSFSAALNYIAARGNFARNALPARVAFAITTNGGQDFTTAERTATIEGTGWIDVRSIVVAGREEIPEVSWPSRDRWTATVSLLFGRNELTFCAFDFSGNLIGADAIAVTSTAEPDPSEFVRGDANGDLVVDVSDAVATLLYLFRSLALPCLDAADANDDERLDLSDALYALEYLFRNGPRPPAPFPSPGFDETGDGSLGCR